MEERLRLRQACISDPACLAVEVEKARHIDAVISGARTRNEIEKTCETCVSYDGIESAYKVNCLAHLSKPTLGIEQARVCKEYQIGGVE